MTSEVGLDRQGCFGLTCAGRFGLIALMVWAFPAAAFATLMTYTVDPTQSQLTLSGSYGGESFQPNPLGVNGAPLPGLIAGYAGTIVADREFQANTLEITGGDISAQANAYGVIFPANATSPADYSVLIGPLGLWPSAFTFEATISNFSFSLSSSIITAPGNFDASTLNMSIISSEFDYEFMSDQSIVIPPNIITTYGSTSFPPTLSLSSDQGSVSDSGNIETLTIPIDASTTLDNLGPLQGVPLYLDFSGQIVATAVVPEPCSCGLLMMFGAYALGTRARRKKFA